MHRESVPHQLTSYQRCGYHGFSTGLIICTLLREKKPMRYEDLKSNLTLCDGERKGGGEPCRGTLYKCKQCGSAGCKQSRDDLCSNQGFSVTGRCLKCEATGQMEAIDPGDYTPQQAWLNPPSQAAN
jgi:hypothetical protein